MNKDLQKIQNQIDLFKERNPDISVGELSDQNHTFEELYHHRTTLLALALRSIPYAWKSRLHDDGTMYDGMFIAGAPTPTGMITYHCNNEFWDLFKIPELPHAPKFDGHTPDDVLDRLENFIKNSTNKLMNPKNAEPIEEILEKDILPVFDSPIDKAAFIGFYHYF